MRNRVCVVAAAVLLCLFSGAAWGQDDQGGNQPRRFDPEQMRQRMLDRTKETLGVTDDEWKALQPKIEAVQKLAMDSRMRGGSMFGRRRGGEDANQPQPEPRNELEKKTRELQALADKMDADPMAVKEKLKEVRDLRDKGKADLKKAQDELRELLTPRQEALMVLMGLLD